MSRGPLGPVAGAYYLDNSRVAIIEGPVGSGKSTASALRLQRHAYQQAPSPDGVRHTRFCIVRNTLKQLVDTTMQTWFQTFPQAEYGPFLETKKTHYWKFTPRGHTHPVNAEFMFRALDNPDDVSDLLSLEVTGFWMNEVREMLQTIIAHAGRRLRYRGGERPHTWRGVIGDTNSWDTEHWLEDYLVTKPREGWKHFQQPGGMDFDAENLANLEQTEETMALDPNDPRRQAQGRTYYESAIVDYSPEDALVYVHAKRGATRDGKPIYTDYSDRVHCQAFEFDRRLPVDIGLDFGRTPAATIGQEFPGGRVQIGYELVATDMGLVKFAEELKRFLGSELKGFKVRTCTGDPSGIAEDSHDETAFKIFEGVGIKTRGARTNEPSIRIETVNKSFRTMSAGRPSLIINPRCKVLRRACIDGYRYKKLKMAGERYSDQPDKNAWSHVAEALQYHLLGLGYGTELVRPAGRMQGPRQRVAISD